jgi:competence protein CoiA
LAASRKNEKVINMSYYDEHEENLNIKLTARKVEDNSLVHANTTTKKDGPFYCPETYEELIVRKCIEKRDHFAYKARQSPVGSKESDLHINCKKEICTILQNRFPEGKWEEERKTFNKDDEKGFNKVEPDISGRIGNKGVIIEVQASVLSIKKIIHRTDQYSMRGGYILWIVPLEEELGTEDFRPRLFERYLHTMYYGRVYYWTEGKGTKLTPVHFGTAERYIEESNWFEPDGTERSEGGYFKPYLRVKKPIYGQEIDLINFIAEDRDEFEVENEKLSIQKCKIFRDNLSTWWKEKKKPAANNS